MLIFLIGYMGSGKSKMGEAASKILKFDFVDTDKLITQVGGKSISEIFEQNGQEHFRELEKDILHTLVSREKLMVATGGGTPMYQDNMDWMMAHGITVYLEANAGLLFHRLASSRGGRPLIEKLNDVELMEQITGHLAVRIPVYRRAAITVSAANPDPRGLAEKIIRYRSA